MSPRLRRSVVYSQNFLHSHRLVDRLLDQSTISSGDLVLEIGPGKGMITERLASRCDHVLAVEKDPVLVQRLRQRFGASGKVVIFETDFLAFPLPASGYKVFASIPFSITAAIVTKLTDGPWLPDDAYLVVQREAAQRFLGETRETLSGVLLKLWFEPTLMYRFRRSDFAPRPEVDVVMLRLRKRGPPLAPADIPLFRDFVVAVFTAWQPTVRHALLGLSSSTATTIEGLGVELGQRPTDLHFADWLSLFTACRAAMDAGFWFGIGGAEARLREQQHGLRKIHRTRVRA